MKHGYSLPPSSDEAFAQGVSASQRSPLAAENNIVSGSNNALMPKGNASRAQTAQMLMRFLENTAK